MIAEAARLLRDGGQLLVVDFAPLGVQSGAAVAGTQKEMGRLGVSDDMLQEWTQRAGLECARVCHLRGETLTVVLSVARHRARNRGKAA